MTILNSTSVAMTLGELNRNLNRVGKQLAMLSSGQRVNSAGDDASGYSISERMRVRVRARDQDERNVQNGAALLRVAEGGVQQQLEIMKTIKAKVIDADNDTNTDVDRKTIQKEILQGYQQINDIAYETNYNGMLLLVGATKAEEVLSWKVLDHPEAVEGSDSLHLIADQYDTLDGLSGPFATLPFYSASPTTAEPLLGTETRVNLAGGTAGYYDDPQTATPSKFTMDFSGYTAGTAEGVGFYITGNKNSASDSYRQYYVLTNNPSGNHYRHGTATTKEACPAKRRGFGWTWGMFPQVPALPFKGRAGQLMCALWREMVSVVIPQGYTSLASRQICRNMTIRMPTRWMMLP